MRVARVREAGGDAAVRAPDAHGVFPFDNAAHELGPRAPCLAGVVEDALAGGDSAASLWASARRRSYSSRGITT